MKVRLFLITSVTTLLMVSSILSAKARGIVFAFDKNHAPFSFIENDEPVGFDIDLLTPIFDDSKYGFAPTEYKWSDALTSLRKGIKVDLMSQMDKTPEREEIYDFSDKPYLSDDIKIYTKKFLINSIEDLSEKKVAVQNGSYYQNLLNENENIIIIPTESENQALNALSKDSVDAFVGPAKVAGYIIKMNGYTNIKPSKKTLGISYMYFAVDKGDSVLLEFINERMNFLRDEGIYDEIYEKWFGSEIHDKERPKEQTHEKRRDT